MNGNKYDQLQSLNENDPIKLLSSNNYLDQLVPIIKTSLQNNTIDELVQKLNDEGSKKDDEIFTVLNENEEKIESSSKEIVTVAKESSTITDQIVDINDHISRTSNLTIEKKFQLLELKKNINKINESEILINKILQVLELADKTHELIKKNKFFNALKNLNDLSDLNKDFEKEFKFLNQINNSIPVLKRVIQDESSGLLKRNLTSLDPKFEQYSEAYYESYSSMVERWDLFKSKNKEFERFKINSSVEISLRSSYTNSELPQPNTLVDYEFIYDTYLVFKTLDQVPFFKNELHKELNIRRDRTLYPFVPSDSNNTNFKDFIKSDKNLKSFLGKLIGYLIFHLQVSEKFPTLIKQSTNDQWENISAKVYPYLKNLILHETFDIATITNIKKIIGQYYLILEHFKLSTEHFYNLLISAFKKFSSLSSFKFDKEFKELADEDESMPMVIYEANLYKKITHISWYEETTPIDKIHFPHALPFSTIYPMTCAQIRNFINQQLGFLKDYYKYELSTLNKFVIDNVNELFKNSINKHFLSKAEYGSSREELAQNLINLEYFIIMTKEVSDILSDAFETDMLLKSKELISNTKTITEKKLFSVVDGKIDDLIEFIDWDWETKSTNREPNYFIKDIGEFLTNMFNSTFKNLPLSVRSLLLYRVFDLLTARFLENLQSQYSISKAAISNFELDISYVQNITGELSSINSTQPSTTSKESLQSMFLALNQVIALLKSGDLEEYKDQEVRSRKYDRVKPDLAVQLINKVEFRERSAGNGAGVQSGTTSSASKIFSKFRGNNN